MPPLAPEAWLAAIIASSDDAIVSKDLNGVVTSWNPAAEQIFGYTSAEMVGRPIDVLIPPERPNEETMILERIRRGDRVDHFQTVRVRKDGRRIEVSVTISPIRDSSGRIVGVSKVARDITDERRAVRTRALLAAIVDSSEDAIVSKNLDGIVTSWNRAAEQVYGYTAAEIIGQSITLLLPPERRPEEAHILEQIRKGNRVRHFETTRMRKDGREIDVSLTISPIRDALGQVIGASHVARDITERKQLEAQLEAGRRQVAEQNEALQRWNEELAVMNEELASTNEELAQVDRQRILFLSTLAHELRNPLNPIRSAVRVLKTRDTSDPELALSQDVIDRQVGQMTRLLEDLLDVSRISRNQLTLRKELVALASVLDVAVETSRPVIEERRHHLELALPDHPIWLEADPVRLAQVFSNLLNNAAKYTDEGGQIRVAAELRGGGLVVSIRDNGIGIPAEMQPRLFDVFTQAKPALERAQGGLGIGLSLVKGLVELHGGTVEARSEGLDQGSEFLVFLPVVQEAPAAGQETPAPRQKPGGPAETLPELACRILVADDNRDGAVSMALMLESTGSEVRTAYDGEQALHLAETWRPDVVLLDIGMPKLNGYDVCRRIREQPWGGKICLIAMTGWGRPEDRERAREAGFDHHLVKPVDPDALLSLLAELPEK